MKFFNEEVMEMMVSSCTCDDQSCVSSGCDPNSCDD